MWSVQNNLNTQTKKITVNFSIDKHLYKKFKRVAQKDMRKYSNIVAVFVDMCGERFKYLCSVVIIYHV